jgi:hypothetical protein
MEDCMEDYELAEEREKQAFVEHLLQCEMLEGDVAVGVARLYVDKGADGMSDKQRHVLKEHVLGEHMVQECSRCAHEIPWSEQLNALDDGGLCGYCEHMMNKDD